MGLFSFAESPQLQALLADIAPPSIRDASYALYFTLAFGVGSLWVAVYGVIIDLAGEPAGLPIVFGLMAVTFVLAAIATMPIHTELTGAVRGDRLSASTGRYGPQPGLRRPPPAGRAPSQGLAMNQFPPTPWPLCRPDPCRPSSSTAAPRRRRPACAVRSGERGELAGEARTRLVDSPASRVNGGQLVAQSPVQALLFAESFLKMYRVMPPSPLRCLPSGLSSTATS